MTEYQTKKIIENTIACALTFCQEMVSNNKHINYKILYDTFDKIENETLGQKNIEELLRVYGMEKK